MVWGLGILCLAAANAAAQFPISAGVKGGVALTDAFENTTTSFGNFSTVGGVYIHNYSPSKDYLVGPFVELRLPFGFAVEADALYRPLHLSTGGVSSIQTGTGLSQYDLFPANEDTHAWEFPILAKYRFKLPIARPYVDLGPSFRAMNGFPNTLSNHGVAAGVGVDIKALVLHISPEVRSTRWGDDAPAAGSGGLPRSNLNQVELLVGISF